MAEKKRALIQEESITKEKIFLCETCGAPATQATVDVTRSRDEKGRVKYTERPASYYCDEHVVPAKVIDG